MDVSPPATLKNPVSWEKWSNPFLTATIISFVRVCSGPSLDDEIPSEIGLGFHATASLFEAFASENKTAIRKSQTGAVPCNDSKFLNSPFCLIVTTGRRALSLLIA